MDTSVCPHKSVSDHVVVMLPSFSLHKLQFSLKTPSAFVRAQETDQHLLQIKMHVWVSEVRNTVGATVPPFGQNET